MQSEEPSPDPVFAEPLPYGYIYLAKSVDPRTRGPFVRASAQRQRVLAEYKTLARQLEATGDVVRATVYRAVFIPPLANAPRFDVVVLIETSSPATIATAQATPAYQGLDADLVLTARNLARFGDTGNDPSATFLFNHFTAQNHQDAASAFPTIARWFATRTDVDNTTALQPTTQAPYALINHVRLPHSPLRFTISQLSKPSFYKNVHTTLKDNNMAALPLFCKPA